MQKWQKLGRIFSLEGKTRAPSWMHSHAYMPFAEHLGNDEFRIYFSVRDPDNRSLPAWIRVDLRRPDAILEISEQPLLRPQGPGFFDEHGVTLCSVLAGQGGERLLYYVGWNRAVSVPFRNAIGLAQAGRDSDAFERVSRGPVLDRSPVDACFVASNCVLREESRWRMWYLSCDEWIDRDAALVHKYNIKSAESRDGVSWTPTGRVCIGHHYPNEYAISVPRVLKEADRYKMWYSYRGGPLGETYRIGYAESGDGESWTRRDHDIELHPDPDPTAWDHEMVCYPCVFDHRGARYMLYNGNRYGATGFGLAVLN